MNKKKHDISRIIKIATSAVFAAAAAAVLYANNHTSLKRAVILDTTAIVSAGESSGVTGSENSAASSTFQSSALQAAENAAAHGTSTSVSGAEAPDILRININAAASEELQALPGIGEAKAAAIIAYREENGGFSDISEITNVSGIGEKMFENIRGSITTGENAIAPGTSTSVSEAEAPGVPPVNINTAASEELQALPGIGEAKAAAIIAYREEHGIFNEISEIMNVSGIGEKIFEQIRGQITV